MRNFPADEPWLLARRTAVEVSGNPKIKWRFGGRSPDDRIAGSPDFQSFLCFFCEESDLGLSSFFVSFASFASFVSLESFASFVPLSPSEAEEDDPAEPALFFA